MKIKNNQMTLLIIQCPKGAMISFLINYLLSVTKFEGHITNSDFLDAMFSAPGLIGIYVKIIFDMAIKESIDVKGAG